MVIFSCENEEKRAYCPQSPDERGKKVINYYLNDSIRVDYSRQVKNFPTIDMDSVYRFRGKGGWGTFDFLCSVYNSDDEYLLELTHEDLSPPGKDDKSVIRTTTPITRDLWNDFVHTIDTLDFWCEEYDMFKRFNITTVDNDVFFTIAKEKDNMRVVKWQLAPRDQYKHPDYEKYKQTIDSYIKLISKGLRVGNYPLAKGIVEYKKEGDSLKIQAYNWRYEYYLLEDIDIIFNGKSIMDNKGFGIMKIHKSDLDTLKHIQFIEEYHDGTIRTFYPHEIKETKSKHF